MSRPRQRFLALPALTWLLWSRPRQRPELLVAGCWALAAWLVYAAGSTNYSGACCSIRWFVPLLAPGYLGLALWLRDRPRWAWDLLVLSLAGTVLAVITWRARPWMRSLVPGFWMVQGAALLAWIGCRWRLWR